MSTPDDPEDEDGGKPAQRREPPRLELAQVRAERERIQREARQQAAPAAAPPVLEHPALASAAPAPAAPVPAPPAVPPVPDAAPALPPKPARVVAPPPELAALLVPEAAPAPPPGPSITTNTVSKPPKAKVRRAQIIGAALGLLALAIPTGLALESYTFREAGIGAFAAVLLAIVSLMAGNIRLLVARKEPRALGLAALAAGAGAGGLLVAALFAHSLHGDATLIRASDVVLEPGMKEHLIGEAQGNGRVVALLGLLTLPGFLIGMLDLALALGERRIAQSAAKLKKLESQPVFPAWVAIAVSSAAFVLGLVLDVWAVFKSVDEAPNPREATLIEIDEAQKRGAMQRACEELEKALAPGYVSERLLEEKLPNHVELANRCVDRELEDLPSGSGCAAAADKLAGTDVARVAGARDRVRQACK